MPAKISNRLIKIAGAGISGMSAAINLHDHGYQVEIYEKNSEIAKRFKGDFQGIENWTSKTDALELIRAQGLEINFQTSASSSFNVCGPKRKLKSFSSGRPFYYLIQRGMEPGNLDYGLYEQIKKRQIPVFFDTKNLPSDIKIFATGPANPSAVIVGSNFSTTHRDTHLMLCDNNLAPSGYAYLLIVNGKGTIATAFKHDGRNANSFLEKTIFAVQSLYDIDMTDIKNFGTYGNYSPENTFKKNNALYVGEAAGLQDYLFGFGLRYAVLSGHLAAISIIENKDYSRLARRAFDKTIKASLVNRFLYEKLDNLQYEFIIERMTKVRDLNSFLRKRYNFGIKRKLLYPIAKAKHK